MPSPVSRVSRWINDLLNPVVEKKNRTLSQRREYGGKHTNLPLNRWFAAMFELNELRAIRHIFDPSFKPLNDVQITYNALQEFSKNKPRKYGNTTVTPGGSISSGAHRTGFFRNRFRKGTLYYNQTKPILMSFKYSNEGHIQKDRNNYSFLTFSQCQQLCIDRKIADPRFFSLEDLEKIQTHCHKYHQVDWSIPTREELKELTEFAGMDLYRSIRTYDIWKSDPVANFGDQYSPPDDPTDEEIQAQHEEEELAKRRHAQRREAKELQDF